MKKNMIVALAAPLLVAAAVSSCSVEASVGTSNSISKSDLASATQKSLAEKFGDQTGEVRCKGDLEKKDGATQECAINDRNGWLPITITAKGSDGKFNYEVGTEVIPEPTW